MNPNEQIFYRKICGDSMLAPYPENITFQPDWILEVAQSDSAEVDSFVVARNKKTDSEIFRKLTRKDGQLILTPLNPDYCDIVLLPSWEVVGVVKSASYQFD